MPVQLPESIDTIDENRGGCSAAAGAASMEATLPVWMPEPTPAESFVRYCHTQKCVDFQSGHCQLHKPMQCFNFHFEGQRRRPPIGPDGRILYWDTACEWLAQPAKCPRGDDCHLAHSKDEVSYHPAKYKTRACNGKDCRKAICCFAHSEQELRSAAQKRYSQAICIASAQQPSAAPSSGSSGAHSTPVEPFTSTSAAASASAPAAAIAVRTPAPLAPTTSAASSSVPFDLSTFKVFPCRQGRNAPHDRKLCCFYHNPRDRRRPPGSYLAEPCGDCFDVEAPQPSRCPRGDDCKKCHNRLELLYHEEVFKQRFCATYHNTGACQRGAYCAFAHSREEIGLRLFSLEEEAGQDCSDEFYMYRFKTCWCPYGVQHDWHQCVYAHTYQDWRRTPELGYSSEPCPHWVKNVTMSEYEDRCPNGFGCVLAHGSKEQLYHPLYYKTMPCTDWTGSRCCPRGTLCAFFHNVEEKRKPDVTGVALTLQRRPPVDLGILERNQPGYRKPPLFGIEDEGSAPRRGAMESSTPSSPYAGPSTLPTSSTSRPSHFGTPPGVDELVFAAESRSLPSAAAAATASTKSSRGNRQRGGGGRKKTALGSTAPSSIGTAPPASEQVLNCSSPVGGLSDSQMGRKRTVSGSAMSSPLLNARRVSSSNSVATTASLGAGVASPESQPSPVTSPAWPKAAPTFANATLPTTLELMQALPMLPRARVQIGQNPGVLEAAAQEMESHDSNTKEEGSLFAFHLFSGSRPTKPEQPRLDPHSPFAAVTSGALGSSTRPGYPGPGAPFPPGLAPQPPVDQLPLPSAYFPSKSNVTPPPSMLAAAMAAAAATGSREGKGSSSRDVAVGFQSGNVLSKGPAYVRISEHADLVFTKPGLLDSWP